MSGTNGDCDREIALVLKDIQSEIIDDHPSEQTSNSPLSRQNILIGNLVEILLDECGLQLANSTAESRVRETIQEMMEENERDGYDDPVSRFRRSWPELSGDASAHPFTVLIPLPVSGQTRSLPNEVNYRGQTIKRVSPDQWGKKVDVARTTQAVDNSRFPENLERFVRGTSLNGISSSQYTFWRFEDEGIDPDYVLQNARTMLDILLGKLSFVADYHSQINVDYSQNQILERSRTTFRLPPFYLIFRGPEFYRVHPEEYPVDKPIPRIRDRFDYDSIFSTFSPLDEFNEPQNSIYADERSVYVRSVEATLGSAISTLGQAMRQNDPESMFLWLYRTLEHITFTNHAGSRECLERALRILEYEEDTRLNGLIDTITNRRNILVHDGTEIEISQTELNLLKSLTISTINSVGHFDSSSVDVIISKMLTRNMCESIESTTSEIVELERELEILEEAQRTTFYTEGESDKD